MGLVTRERRSPVWGANSHLFYPSCGTRSIGAVLRLNYERCTLVDKRPKVVENLRHRFRRRKPLPLDGLPGFSVRPSRQQTLRVYQADNREVLAQLRREGERVDALFGVCDGCREGGNDECVHDLGFMSALLPLLSPTFDIFTDHSPLLAVEPSWWDRDRRRHLSFRKERLLRLEDGRARVRLQGVLARVDEELVVRAVPTDFGGPEPDDSGHPLMCLRPFRERLGGGSQPMLAWYRGVLGDGPVPAVGALRPPPEEERVLGEEPVLLERLPL